MRRIFPILLALVALGWLTLVILELKPPHHVTIYSGPVQGSYHLYASRYLPWLVKVAPESVIVPEEESLRIPARVAGTPGGQAIGFASIRSRDPGTESLRSVGVIDIQPLFIFQRRSLGTLASLAEARGLRVVTPPSGSASAMAADALLDLHGFDRTHNLPQRLPLPEAVKALREGRADIGFFMLSASNPLVRQMALDGHLSLVSLPHNESIARNLDYLVPMKLPQGLFDIGANQPPQDVHLVGSPIDVIVQENINPAVLQRLLAVMEESHRGLGLLHPRGRFPSVADSAWPVHPAAREYARSGASWMYQRLWPWPASVIDLHWPVLLFIAGIGSFWSGMKNLAALVRSTRDLIALAILRRLVRRRLDQAEAAQGPLDPQLQALAEALLDDESAQKIARKLLETLRTPPKP